MDPLDCYGNLNRAYHLKMKQSTWLLEMAETLVENQETADFKCYSNLEKLKNSYKTQNIPDKIQLPKRHQQTSQKTLDTLIPCHF